jgi:YbbR domain-containing protein
MTVVRFLLHNWPLKVLALGLAILLYAGMVVLQNTQPWPGQVPVLPVNQPADSYLVKPDPLPQVSDIRYLAPPDVRLTAASFRATIDLTGAKVSENERSLVKVQLVCDEPRVQIIDYQPQQIWVTLDPIVTRQVSVRVKFGAIPSGLQPGLPVVSDNQVDVIGAASIVRRVAYAEALVSVDASGLDVNEVADLVARDASDALVENVQFSPRSVTVQAQVGSQLRTVTVPVNVVVTGTPTAGYYISSIEIDPLLVSVRGQANALAKINGVANTKAISVEGATGDISTHVKLDLPAGVEAVGTSTVSIVIHLQSPDSSRSLTVGVVPEGARPDRAYTLSSPNVIVTIGGPEAALNALDTASLYATVSVGDLGLGSHSNVQVSIDLPPGFRLLAISPGAINVIVEVAPAPTPT